MHVPCKLSISVHLTEAQPESLTGAKLIAGPNWPRARDFGVINEWPSPRSLPQKSYGFPFLP